MAELTIDKTYAKGLFLAAGDLEKTGEIMEEIKELISLFDKEKEFFQFICSPIVSGSEKKQVIRKVFTGRLSQETVNFLLVLVDKGRATHLHAIVKQYELLLNESRGFSKGVIYSVVPLSEEQLASFEEKAGNLVGKKVKLQNRMDKNLIGGVRIFVEGRLIDASVKKRLTDLKESMMAGT